MTDHEEHEDHEDREVHQDNQVLVNEDRRLQDSSLSRRGMRLSAPLPAETEDMNRA